VSVSRLTVSAEHQGERVDRYLALHLPEVSRARVQALISAGRVTVDGALVKPSARVLGDQVIEVDVPAPVSAVPQAEALPLTVLHEDADVLVLDKAAGMVVHPGAGHASGTLVNALLHHVTDLSGVGGELRPGIVHRLDKDTSGVMVIAKHEVALVALQRSFASRTVEKIYLAIVAGHPAPEGTFRTLHARHPTQRRRFTGRLKTGKPAVTHYRVLERLADTSLVEVRLETGRTHQIRMHFFEAGHPLLGDPLYSARASSTRPDVPRLTLHAHRLGFVHPRTKKAMTFVAPLPADLQRVLEGLRGRPSKPPRVARRRR
jgi:23S rRNA pseudouridine1911/1915/1917 synthase